MLAATRMSYDASVSSRSDGVRRAATVDPIRYNISFPAPHTHYVEVSATVPTDGRAEVELMMAVWTPGSYLVREFERNVEAVSAAAPDGEPMTVVKSEKNRWHVSTDGAP